MVVRGQRIYRSVVNYSEIEGSFEFDRFRVTSVKMEEVLSMVGPFLHRETNGSCAQMALHWLGTGHYHSVGDTVSEASVCTPVFISDLTL